MNCIYEGPPPPDLPQAKAITLALAKTKLQKLTPSAPGLSLIEQLRQRTTYMTVGEFAVLIGETPAGVYKRINEGRLPHVKLGYGIRLDPAVMANWLEARCVATVGTAASPSRRGPRVPMPAEVVAP